MGLIDVFIKYRLKIKCGVYSNNVTFASFSRLSAVAIIRTSSTGNCKLQNEKLETTTLIIISNAFGNNTYLKREPGVSRGIFFRHSGHSEGSQLLQLSFNKDAGS